MKIMNVCAGVFFSCQTTSFVSIVSIGYIRILLNMQLDAFDRKKFQKNKAINKIKRERERKRKKEKSSAILRV
jgi:hypothetical protein